MQCRGLTSQKSSFHKQFKPVATLIRLFHNNTQLATNSALERPRQAARLLAPTEVPDRINCLPIALSGVVRGKASTRRMMRSPNCLVRSFKSFSFIVLSQSKKPQKSKNAL
jgi:hypothetical protein